jgi:hypothetical protein
MSKTQWGLKRQCPSCGVRFYDLGKNPANCPKCGFLHDINAPVKAKRRGRSKAVEVDDDEPLMIEKTKAEARQKVAHKPAKAVKEIEGVDLGGFEDIEPIGGSEEEVEEIDDEIETIEEIEEIEPDEAMDDDIVLEKDSVDEVLIDEIDDSEEEVEEDEAEDAKKPSKGSKASKAAKPSKASKTPAKAAKPPVKATKPKPQAKAKKR